MYALRLALLLISLLTAVLFLQDKAYATRDERSVLTSVGRIVLDQRISCLATWTNSHFFSGTYGFGRGGIQTDQAWLDPVALQARGRSVTLYAGAPAGKRPVFISSTIDMLVGCGDPIQLSTPIFAGDLAFVSARYSDRGGQAFALRRSGSKWIVVGATQWSNGVVI